MATKVASPRQRATTRRTPPRRPSPRRRDDHAARELIGLALVAVGVFLGLAIFLGVGVGPVGGWLEDGVRLVIGRAVVVAPVLLVGVGVLVILKHPILSSAPFRTGSAILLGAVTLALAAGSLGLSDGGGGAFADDDLGARGGVIGEALWLVTGSTVGSIGTAILVVCGLIAGVVLVSGASLAMLLRRSSSGAAKASRSVGRGMATATGAAVRGGQRLGVRAVSRPDPSTSSSASAVPPLDGADSWPDLYAEPSELPSSPALGPLGDEHETDPGPPPAPGARTGDGDGDASRDVDQEGHLDEDPEEDPDPLGVFAARPTADGPPPPAAEAPTVVVPVVAPGTGDAPAGYVRPDASLLKHSENPGHLPDGVIEETSGRLVEALGHFGIEASVSDTVSGPRVTRYELRLAPGTKVARVSALRDDIAYALAARDEIRIIAPIPGKRAVGVEVPNPDATLVTLGDIYRDFPAHTGPLMTWLGPDISGKPVYVDLARMPHLLIAGSTGTGKSVCLNAILASILLRSTPDELRMILIDPKKVELNHYEHIPHLLTPVVTNMKDAAAVLSNVVREMESRYELMGMARARNLRDWNTIREAEGERPMPTVLVLIDELADLMMVSPAEVEDAIIRLAQKSRAVGIHLVLATQRPSADVITGMIKANVPSRIAFAVSSQVDSRVILDAGGAESLLGSGDMLFRPVGSSRLQRLQGAYVSEEEILAVTDHWRAQGRPRIRTELLERRDGPEEVGPQDGDEMLAPAVELVVQQGTASVSLLQRRLGVGYARAGRLVDVLERMGVVSGHEGSKPRSVLIGPGEVDRVLGRTAAVGDDPEDVEPVADAASPEQVIAPREV